jgi:hypothetical protein
MTHSTKTDRALIQIFHRFLIVLLLSAIAGCSTTRALQKPVPPGDGKALVYLIRQNYPPYVRELRVNVNGQLVATIANNDLVAVNLPLGVNSILLEVNDGKPLSFDMPIDKPERRFMVLTGDVKTTGQEMTGYNRLTVYMNWTLRAYQVSRQDAEAIASEFGKRIE